MPQPLKARFLPLGVGEYIQSVKGGCPGELVKLWTQIMQSLHW